MKQPEGRASRPSVARSALAAHNGRVGGAARLVTTMAGFLFAVLLVPLSPFRLQAEVGYGDSLDFTLDVRYQVGLGFSRGFTLDTRMGALLGSDLSDVFPLDTRIGQTPSVALSGRVTDTAGNGLAEAGVVAVSVSLVVATSSSDPNGYYTLPLLPPGTYALRAAKPDYLTSIRMTGPMSAGQTFSCDFALAPRPDPPRVQPGSFTPTPPEQASTGQLKLWHAGVWEDGLTLDSSKTTVIITHGWNGDSETLWLKKMASNLATNYPNTLNIAAWDWRVGAGTRLRLSQAFYNTRDEGEALGEKLATDLPSGSRPPLHFIGFSLGTLVNAAAADYLHETASPAFDWRKTHMTLLDNAVIANLEGQLVDEDLAELVENGVLWHTPDKAAWIDNYISLFGMPSLKAVNVHLVLGPDFLAAREGGTSAVNPYSLHSYACNWYSLTIGSPSDSPLGHRYSFEKLGSSAAWPTPSPYACGTLLEQDSLRTELSLAPVYYEGGNLLEYWARRSVSRANQAFLGTVEVVGGVAVAVGDAVATTVDEVKDGVSDAWGWAVTLFTKPGAQSPVPGPAAVLAQEVTSNTPPFVRMTVAVPSNATTLTFVMVLQGDGKADSFVFAVNGTNQLTLRTGLLPQGLPVPSGPFDMTGWQGQNVQLEFGIAGGTSTNASITVEHLHFSALLPPALSVGKSSNGVVLAWPLTATGYGLESTPTLGTTTQWTPVTNAPGISGFDLVVTNAITETNEFFRLRKQ